MFNRFHFVRGKLKVVKRDVGLETRNGLGLGERDVALLHRPLDQELGHVNAVLGQDGLELFGWVGKFVPVGQRCVCLHIDPLAETPAGQFFTHAPGAYFDLIDDRWVLQSVPGQELLDVVLAEVRHTDVLDRAVVDSLLHRLVSLETLLGTTERRVNEQEVDVA